MPGDLLSEDVCILPGGLALDDGRCLSRAELRPLTGREEEWLAWHAAAPSAFVVTKLLCACLARLEDVKPDPELVRQLLVGDRDFLILQLRQMTLGEGFAAVLPCPACSARMDVDFLARDVPVERRPQRAAVYTWHPEGRAERELPVRFRLPNGADQEAVAEMPLAEAVKALLARCLIDDGGAPLANGEHTALIAEMDRLAPQLELDLDLTCPECGHSFVTPFDTTTFFFSEMRLQTHHLLREVHHLAFYYHWSEAEILGLRRDQRRAYLALLNEALRPD